MNSSSEKVLPTVTIAIPTLNEEANIESVLSDFSSNTYPNICEILVADGGSSDKTRDIVNKVSKQNRRIHLIINEQKIQATALNLMISKARGDIFIRADAHCEYSYDYVEKCVTTLLKTGAHNVGGAQRYIAKDEIQAGIALASRSYLGNGGAHYKDPDYDGFADTVFLGCYYTKDLRELGGYRSCVKTNEDTDLNLRLNAKFGNCIYVSSQIQSWYYPRSSFSSLVKQYKIYGEGRCLTHYANNKMSAMRGRIPFWILFLSIIYLLMDVIFISHGIATLGILIGVLTLYLFESFRISVMTIGKFIIEIWYGSNRNIPDLSSRIKNCFISIICMQVAHSIGYGKQFFRLLFKSENTAGVLYRLNVKESKL